MAVIRLTILVIVLGGLTLLLAQNFSPALPLVFLGARTQPFPLAMWILFSTVAGATTSLIVRSLFGFAGLGRAIPKASKNASSYRQQETTSRNTENKSQSSEYRNNTRNNTSSKEDDWDLDGASEDWDFESKRTQANAYEQDKRDRRVSDEEVEDLDPAPKSSKQGSKQDTSYSYSSREPKDSGVGKTESIYDADYRVIVPPYNPNNPVTPPSRPEPKQKQSSDDDWSFFDEDNEK